MKRGPSSRMRRFLRWFCPPSLYEGIEGDLLEQYEQDVRQAGEKPARRRFVWNVLRFFRPAILLRNKFSFTNNRLSMFGNYFKVARRNMVRHRAYTFINMAGLTLGLTIALVLFRIVRFEHSFDGFHKHADRLYQVISYDKFGEINSYVPQGAIYALRGQFSEVEQAATVHGWEPQVIRTGQENLEPGNTFFIHPEFLKMIDVEWIAGSVESSLAEPYQVVLDRPTAERLFHGEDPLGKVIRYDNAMDLTVSGIIEKMPVNSAFRMPMIMSYQTLMKYHEWIGREDYWGGGDSWFQGYILLAAGADPGVVEERLTAMASQHEDYSRFELLKLSQAHFDQDLDPFNYAVQPWMLHLLWGIAFFLIVIACINFVNLATAQAAQRSREIGMRKVMGSSRGSIVLQFLTETGVMVTLSVIVAALAASVLMPYAGGFFNTRVSEAPVWDVDIIAWLVVLIVAVTFLAGFYPALILSGLSPARAFQRHNVLPGKGVSLRKSLVVAQFVIAQVIVICMVTGIRQVRFFYHTDPGFNRESVVTVNMPYKDKTLLRERFGHALLRHPSIKAVTFGLTSPSSQHNWWWGNTVNPKLLNGEQAFRLQWVDDNYFDFYNIPLVAGRTFVETDTLPVALINEKAVHDMGLKDAGDALGEKFTYWDKNAVTVIGVVKNYYSQSLKAEIPPHLYLNAKWNFQLAQIRIDPAKTAEALAAIKKHWTYLHPDHYFEYEFLSESLDGFYDDERKLSNFIILFAVVGLSIGCLGLYGLVSFVCSRRAKEVSIRKVLGATISNILSLLTKDFLVLVVIAFFIAVPAGWYLMDRFLQEYTYHINIHWSVFILAGSLTLAVALLTVSVRSLGAAMTNPADNLKYE